MIGLFLAFVLSASSTPQEPIRVLVFSKTAGYRHDSIANGIEAIRRLAAERGWEVETTEDAERFDDERLLPFDVVVFLMTTGDVLDPSQQSAFERFIRVGKGYVGVHSAADTEYDWPWYGRLVGAYFTSHPDGEDAIQRASYVVEDETHPATAALPTRFEHADEHYNFDKNPRENVHVLMSLDETSYDVGEHAMGDHPIAWCQELDSGRAFYTGLGHTKESYEDELFLGHLSGGIEWAAGR